MHLPLLCVAIYMQGGRGMPRTIVSSVRILFFIFVFCFFFVLCIHGMCLMHPVPTRFVASGRSRLYIDTSGRIRLRSDYNKKNFAENFLQ